MKHAVLNGSLLPETQATVSILDRSFLYGDGLFETMAVRGGRPLFWKRHLDRLLLGARSLGIRLPCPEPSLFPAAVELIARNAPEDGILRLHLSRGVGRRGYSPVKADSPVLTMTTHAAPVMDPARPLRWRLMTSAWPLPPFSPLTPIKTANKLVAIMARAEAEAVGMNEALMLNPAGQVVEGAASNIFWIENGRLCTPPLTAGALAGVTRGIILELARDMQIPVTEPEVEPEVLKGSDGVFLTLSTYGVVPAVQLDGSPLRESHVTLRLQNAYEERVQRGE